MPAEFPVPLMCYDIPEEESTTQIAIEENKADVITLSDGRKLHIRLENPATKKAPVSIEELNRRYLLAAVLFFVVLAICLAFTFFASI